MITVDIILKIRARLCVKEKTYVLWPRIWDYPDTRSLPPLDTNKPKLPTKFKGTVTLSTDRPARDMTKIIEGIIDQLTNITGADVDLTLEIHAGVPTGLDKNEQRTLLANANTLSFKDKDIS